MIRRFAVLALVVLGAWTMAAGEASGWAARGRYHSNPYTGGHTSTAGAYNPYTGGAYHGASHTNAYTGRTTSAQKSYNPYTNTYSRSAETTNPMTGQSAYHYQYARP